MKKKPGIWQYIVAVIICLIYVSPIYILSGVAFKKPTDTSSIWKLPNYLDLTNFTDALKSGNLLSALNNSLIITVVTVLLIIIVGSFAAYPLARRKTKFNIFIRAFILGIMMVPPLSILVPLFSNLVKLGGVNEYWGIILTLLTFELPLSIFMYTNFIQSIPIELDEAAAIDGCGPIRTFFLVIFPQLKPVTASVAILTGVHCWNDFQFSLYLLQAPEKKTVTLAISSFFSQTTSNLNAAAAGALLAILPLIILFLFLQKYFIRGMVDSAIK